MASRMNLTPGRSGPFRVAAVAQLGRQFGKQAGKAPGPSGFADQSGGGRARSLLDNLTRKANASHGATFRVAAAEQPHTWLANAGHGGGVPTPLAALPPDAEVVTLQVKSSPASGLPAAGPMNYLPVFRRQDLRLFTLLIGRRADCQLRICQFVDQQQRRKRPFAPR
jgi:hypothetical protein